MKFFFLALGLFAFAQSYGQNDQDTVYQLENVVINSNALESSYREYTGGVSYISNHQLAVSDPTILTPLINHSPGIYMSQGALNTNKIIIRGIGSRAQYGTSKLRAYYGDIPLTDGSGETVVEDIDLNAIGSVEILKGPNSSLYGTGLGGTLTLNPSKPEIGRFRAYNDLTLGSYRLLRESAGMESADEQHDFRLNYTHMSSEGYRDNSQFDRSSLTATTHLYNGKNKLGFLAYFVDQKAFIPSSISEDDFLTNPQTAAFTWQATEGYESYSRLMAGVSLDHDYGNGLSQITSFFSTFRQGYEPRPFDILRENTAGLGGRTRLIQSLADGKHTLSAGAEWFHDRYQWQTYTNLYKAFPGQGSVRDSLRSDNTENRTYVNGFMQAKFTLTPALGLETGFNLNTTHYDYEDYYLKDGDQSGTYSFRPVFSPRLSLRYDLLPTTTAYMTASHGFSPPSLTETLLPDGTINPDIQPETGINYEIGFKGFYPAFHYSLSAYQMEVSNLIVAQRIGPDQYMGMNAGKTRHPGLEGQIAGKLIDGNLFRLSLDMSGSLTRYRFIEFENEGIDYAGNKLTGVPNHQFSSFMRFSLSDWLYGFVNAQAIGRLPMNDANTLSSSPYQVVNAQLGLRKSVKSLGFDLSYMINNLLDEHYASMILTNAIGFGASQPRYYYPGMPRNHQIRLRVTFDKKNTNK